MKTIHVTIKVLEGEKEPPRLVDRIDSILANAFFEDLDQGNIEIEILVEE